jgi:hypothetical protein
MPPNVEAARLNGDLPSLAAALRYPAYRTRCEAAWALAEEGEDGVAVLRRALTDPEPRVRASAADGLGEVDWDTVDANVRAVAVARLRVASRDPVESVRMAASAALGRMDAEDEPDPWAEIDEDEETPPDPLAHLRSDDAADDVRLAWLATHPRTPELPAATGASAAPTPARKTMAVCPRCQRLCKPEWVRCHHCGAKMKA